jgi:hypothetical protein
MTIEIRDASLEARIKKQLQATGSSSVEEVPLRWLNDIVILLKYNKAGAFLCPQTP